MSARISSFTSIALLLRTVLATGPAWTAEPIKIGDLNSYTRLPAFSLPYQKGWQLALEEINGAGGVLGRPLQVVGRDDGGKPGDAVTVVNELVSREKVAALMGTLLSHVGIAVSDVARRKRILFLAAEPLSDAIAWSKGNHYTFGLRPGTYVQAAMLAEAAAKLPAKRWAVVAPNYEYGQSAVAAFKKLLTARRPEVEFVAEQWPALFKIDAGSTQTEAMIAALRGLAIATPFGPIRFRAADQQSTMGTFIGRTTLIEGVGAMRDWRYGDGADYLPSEDEVKALRPAE